jgi:hypothetical protein
LLQRGEEQIRCAAKGCEFFGLHLMRHVALQLRAD